MKKKINIVIIFYLVLGSYLSINTGISHDELHEQINWYYNSNAYKSILGLGDYNELKNYIDRYHGVAFHFISQPIQLLIFKATSYLTGLNLDGAYLLSKHLPNFFIFFISGLYFKKLCFYISNSNTFSRISTLLYFFFPYLLGHSFINPKDIPFLSFWLISTYYFFKILKKFLVEKKIFIKDIIKISFFASFLLSIRIVGILIFIEFILGLFFLFNLNNNINFFETIKINLKKIIYFIFLFIFFMILFNPVFWSGLGEIKNSISHLSKYYHNVCTLTFGTCEPALDLPAKYYFIWFFFKLPLISLIGIFLYPLIEKKVFQNNFSALIFLTFVFTFFGIISMFILFKVSIYDEIRHILFLIPLILIISLHNLYLLNKRVFFFISMLTLSFFLIDNIKLNPYQYTWLNTFARYYEINKNFETDYWGTSNLNLQRSIVKFSKENKFSNSTCVYGDEYVDKILSNNGFNCTGKYSEINSVRQRPFVAYQNLRNLKKNDPSNCKLIHEEKYKYLFFKQEILVGKVWYCY